MTPARVPDLPAHCGSWVIVRKGTLRAVFETFERATAERVNGERFDVLTAADYLARINSTIKG